jgi:hypothetical protein
MRRLLLLAAATTTCLAAAPPASAGPLDQLYAPIHIRPNIAPSPLFITSHFDTISIHTSMLKLGYKADRTGFYVKATRSASPGFPESWYLHGSDGRRSRDGTWGFFVMNPANTGWRNHVAGQCRSAFCFLDALGENGYERARPRPVELTRDGWNRAAAGLAAAVEAKSSAYRAVANNVVGVSRPSFDIGFEMFARTSAEKSLSVVRNTNCYCFVKLGTERGSRYGFTLFLAGASSADRVSVGTDSQLGKWWPIFDRARSLGSPSASAKWSGNVITRPFTGGAIVTNTGSSGRRVSIAGKSVFVAAKDGAIVLR